MAIRKPTARPSKLKGEWSHLNGVKMTVEEFLRIDDTEESDLEYVDGVAWEKGVVDRKHGTLVGEFAYQFGAYRRVAGGEFGPDRRVRIGPRRYFKVDLGYYAPGSPMENDDLPTLAIEVRSPDETMAAQRRKCRRYREAGVPVCWLIDPISRSVEVFEGARDGERLPADGTLASPHIPGFALPLSELFAVIDR
jgi:Uma2 family endonuclease